MTFFRVHEEHTNNIIFDAHYYSSNLTDNVGLNELSGTAILIYS